MSVASNIQTSKISNNPRPVEKLVINRLERISEKRLEEVVETIHHLTRLLVKDLFNCKTIDQVDKVIERSLKCNDSIEDECGVNPGFQWRIRNAELQVRDLIENGKTIDINPQKAAIIVKNSRKGITASLCSWGHLADYLLKGYEVVVD